MTRHPSYGDVTGEYLALRRGAALVPESHEVIWVRGPDTVSFLDGLLSQAIAELDIGDVSRSLLLSPQGKLRATLVALRSDDGVALVSSPGVGAAVIADLNRFKIRVDATIEPAPTVLDSVVGPEAAGALARAGYDPPVPGAWVRTAKGIVATASFGSAGLPRYLISTDIGGTLVDSGVSRAGDLAATTVRIEAGEALVGVDIDERTIPQEADLVEGAVSFTKGCYLGQELVARIDSRGRVNRHLRGLVITTNVLPPPGAEVMVGDTTVGSITSVGESLDLRAPVALALIRREASPGDHVTVRWEGGATSAVVQELPLIR